MISQRTETRRVLLERAPNQGQNQNLPDRVPESKAASGHLVASSRSLGCAQAAAAGAAARRRSSCLRDLAAVRAVQGDGDILAFPNRGCPATLDDGALAQTVPAGVVP